MAEYCTYEDVTDIVPSSIIGTNAGQFASGQIMRIVAKKSAEIEYWNNKVPFAQTTVTNEYHELVGLDKFALEREPVISITTLEIEETSGTWTAKTQGRTASTDDYFLENSDNGFVTFHNAPAAGLWCRVTYEQGYATNPIWLRDLCSKMVAVELFKNKTFDEECENLFKYWLDEIREYKKDIKDYKDQIKKRRIVARTLGARWATTPVNELSKIRRYNE